MYREMLNVYLWQATHNSGHLCMWQNRQDEGNWIFGGQWGWGFFLNFLFHVGIQPINSVAVVLGDIEGTQPYTYMYPFSPKLPSHPGCHITLSREELWDFVLTLGLLQGENRDLSDLRILRLAHSLSSGRGIGRVPDRATFTEPYQVSALLNSPPNPEKSFSCLAAW